LAEAELYLALQTRYGFATEADRKFVEGIRKSQEDLQFELEILNNEQTTANKERNSKIAEDNKKAADEKAADDKERADKKAADEKQRQDASSPVRSIIEKSERTRGVIEELIPSLFPLKVKQLSTSMTKVYKELAHKSQVSKILIDNDGTTKILSENGKELTFDRSAGENQIFATALIAGLAEVSRIKAPLVVDTPLGRLDSKHRKNIFDFWTGDSSRQVILLSQDEEISSAHIQTIKSNVCKTYLLEHVDVGDGIGRTTAVEDKYFGAN
jgi:DNA sulfur modification protein DndD